MPSHFPAGRHSLLSFLSPFLFKTAAATTTPGKENKGEETGEGGGRGVAFVLGDKPGSWAMSP